MLCRFAKHPVCSYAFGLILRLVPPHQLHMLTVGPLSLPGFPPPPCSYAFGLILWELLTWELPFMEMSTLQVRLVLPVVHFISCLLFSAGAAYLGAAVHGDEHPAGGEV